MTADANEMTAAPTRSSPEPTVAAGMVIGLLDYAASKGASRAELLRRGGVDPSVVENADNRAPMSAYKTMMRAAAEQTRDPHFALHWSEAVDMSEVSIVGLIMNASETMWEAFVQMQRFGRLAVEVEGVSDGPRFQPAMQDGQLWMVDTRANPNDFPELTESAFVRLTCGPRRFLPRPHILEVHFTHPGPADRSEYDRIFQCPVAFNSHWNAMHVDASISNHRVRLQPRYAFGVLSEKAEALLQELEAAKSTRAQVERLMIPILHTGDIRMDDVAAGLAMSRQTLARRLKAEATTFEQVLDELRHRLALHYLSGRKASVNETAYLVGFSDPSAFSRAFKRWEGRSPGDAKPRKT